MKFDLKDAFWPKLNYLAIRGLWVCAGISYERQHANKTCNFFRYLIDRAAQKIFTKILVYLSNKYML